MVRAALIFLLATSCSTTSKLRSGYPDEMIIYHLYPLRTSLVSISCEKVKDMPDAKKIIVKDVQEIKKRYQLFEDKSNFQLDKSIVDLDARVSIVFRNNGIDVKRICWSNVKRCEMNGGVYKYNEEVEKFLLDYGLIFKM